MVSHQPGSTKKQNALLTMVKALLTLFIFFQIINTLAQERTIRGKVVLSDSQEGIEGVNIAVLGTQLGTVTQSEGQFTITLSDETVTLVFSSVFLQRKEVEVTGAEFVYVEMHPAMHQMEEFVVTALGVSRSRKSLGYATQSVAAEDLQSFSRDNFLTALSGRVAGARINHTGNMGGSANIIIRGHNSLSQNNQALFVVDGVPFNNDNSNHPSQISGRYGFDFGNAASDINLNDVSSLTILKGAAATALYGSRASSGVVVISSQTAEPDVYAGGKPRISIGSSVSTGFIDPSTFPAYQNSYGAGYGPYYGDVPFTGFENIWDVNGNGTPDLTVPTSEDASMGQAFDPNLMVYQWDAFYPASPNYQTPTPWVAASNGPMHFFETPLTLNNSFSVAGAENRGSYRFSYTNFNHKGILPNAQLQRDNLHLNASYKLFDNVTLKTTAGYIHTRATGRNMTGYSENVLTSFRQWMQTNVDFKAQKEMYEQTGQNITWNPQSPFNLAPAYWNNPWFQRFENYSTDWRRRLNGLIELNWEIVDNLNLLFRTSADTYTELQEERRAIGSASEEFGIGRMRVSSGYARLNRTFTENNFDFLLNYYSSLGRSFSLFMLAGTNIRRTQSDQTFQSTDGGLVATGVYALSNSVNPNRFPEERFARMGVNGYFMNASVGYRGFLFAESSVRVDQSSTLPRHNNTYLYPSLSGSYIFSENLDIQWLSLGKLRLGWARVGNDAPWGSVQDTYTQHSPFAGTSMFSMPLIKNNENLKPESTQSLEAGLEASLWGNRFTLDLSVYQNNTSNQIMPVSVSSATGYIAKFVNGGEVENKGVEVFLSARPIAQSNLKWDIMLNWSANRNRIKSLVDGVENLQLAAFQGGITINARKGHPYGTIQGTDYIYTNGQKTVGDNGYYLRTATSNHVLGNTNPDWHAGLGNRLLYKNWSLSFLLDWQQGGSVYSLDMHYGLGTGLYEETVFLNDLGNPVRLPVAEGRGMILDGVTADGSPNTTRIEANNHRAFGWLNHPNRAFVYDATYVKLREVAIGYTIPASSLEGVWGINSLHLGITGSNLWIIHKVLPHADPEAGHSSGNIMGWQSGVMPTLRTISFNIRADF